MGFRTGKISFKNIFNVGDLKTKPKNEAHYSSSAWILAMTAFFLCSTLFFRAARVCLGRRYALTGPVGFLWSFLAAGAGSLRMAACALV